MFIINIDINIILIFYNYIQFNIEYFEKAMILY